MVTNNSFDMEKFASSINDLHERAKEKILVLFADGMLIDICKNAELFHYIFNRIWSIMDKIEDNRDINTESERIEICEIITTLSCVYNWCYDDVQFTKDSINLWFDAINNRLKENDINL